MQENKFAETVILIDAKYFEFLTSDFKANFERMLGRELKTIDLSDFLTYISLEGGVSNSDNNIQVIFIYDQTQSQFTNCVPSSIKDELNGTAFKNNLGEYSMHSFSNENLVSVQEMYLDSLNTILESKDVKRLLVVGDNEKYGKEIAELLENPQGKLLVNFTMTPPTGKEKYKTEILGYSVMEALGIRSEEL